LTRRALALAVLSGLLLSASFPNLAYSYLSWFALVPFLVALRDQAVRTALWLSGIFGLVFFCGTFYWVTHSVHFYGNVPLLPASFINLLLCLILALFIVPFGGAIVHIRMAHPRLLFLAAPSLWVALEYARTHLLTGFPWALLGYSQYRSVPIIQFADITGVYGVSFVIVLVNTGIADVLADRRRYSPLLAAFALLAAVLGYGFYRLNLPEGPGHIKIAVVQGNIDQDKKWDRSYQNEVIATYERLTLKALQEKPDIIIWPETATPFYFGAYEASYPALTEDLRRFVRASGTPLLTGSATLERRLDRSPILKNSAYLLAVDGSTTAVYDKIHLVPFGEYVPMKDILFFAKKMVEGDVDFQPGKEHTVMQVRLPKGTDVAIGTVICYEIIFPDLVRQFVKRGATVLTTATNDAWFGRTGAPYQHFSMAVLRAVENRVPIARAANTGVSGFIDDRGRILATTNIFTEAVLTRTLTPGTVGTFYTRYGDVFSWLCTLASILAVIPLPRFR
jgi:apolipoprotein N-acyltransferase